jgi:hypothetical protein
VTPPRTALPAALVLAAALALVAFATRRAPPTSAPDAPEPAAESGADGAFVLAPLGVGDVRLEASSTPSWRAPKPFTVAAGERAVELRFRSAPAEVGSSSAVER